MRHILLTLIFVIAAIAIIVIAAMKLLLNKKSKKISSLIESIRPYSLTQDNEKRTLKQDNEQIFIDIKNDLEQSYNGKYINPQEEEKFTDYYIDLYNEIILFRKQLKNFRINTSYTIAKFTSDFENIHSLVKIHNEQYIQNELDSYKDFFDHCLKYPLDKQQRRSIVSDAINCLVISSAGSGKTSSIVGKVKYLIDIKHINPQNILLISYTNKAAAELTERMGIDGIRGYTFHKLAIDIIGQTTGQKPSICSNTDALFLKIYNDLLNDESFKKGIVDYIINYQLHESEWEQQKNHRRQQLSEQKNTTLKAQFPDMDGKTIYVRSEQEQKICLVLSSLGVKFRYEENYEHQLADETHSQYKPDFSIYYNENGETKRIYLEHFGIDEHSNVPLWFAKDRGITYEEANQKYNNSITWKKAAHEKFGTRLLTTSSADFNHCNLRNKLKMLLEKEGVPINEKTDSELYNAILPSNSKQEKSFIRLIVTFITLAKSSCKSINEVLLRTKNENDERSESLIKNIFQPIYLRYIDELKSTNQIDFTDAILQATDICRSYNPAKYEYIIVDEFQDISVDRYNFLKVLRGNTPPAKLYCVGDDWQSIYRFSGSDMALFNQFQKYFGETDINKIETTYRFGEPLVSLSSQFIQRNAAQIKKDIHPFNSNAKTELNFCEYERSNYCNIIEQLVASIPLENSVFLIGRYSFDDYYLSYKYKSTKEGNRFFYLIGNRKIEFLTAHKSKGLEADYVIILQCNNDIYGFPSLISDNNVLNYVLTKSEQYPFAEERRLFYVAITRAKIKTIVMYDKRFPSMFVNEFLFPERIAIDKDNVKHRNANKRWTKNADQFLLKLHSEGKSIRYISAKMGRSQTAIIMRLNILKQYFS